MKTVNGTPVPPNAFLVATDNRLSNGWKVELWCVSSTFPRQDGDATIFLVKGGAVKWGATAHVRADPEVRILGSRFNKMLSQHPRLMQRFKSERTRFLYEQEEKEMQQLFRKRLEHLLARRMPFTVEVPQQIINYMGESYVIQTGPPIITEHGS